ncbi:MAG: hypothetical protein Q4F10_04745 [Corynebacterium glutamicum]|nr:hypothetical protein [Corynebacterium glutamicum]
MYNHATELFVKRPIVRTVTFRSGLKLVRMYVEQVAYDMEIEEALKLANRLVDAVEWEVKNEV